MKLEKLKINNIPSIIWGEKRNKVYVAVHGNMSNKEDEVIKILAEKVVLKGYQLLSFDLPERRMPVITFISGVFRTCLSFSKYNGLFIIFIFITKNIISCLFP